jgi:hypothetical protein
VRARLQWRMILLPIVCTCHKMRTPIKINVVLFQQSVRLYYWLYISCFDASIVWNKHTCYFGFLPTLCSFYYTLSSYKLNTKDQIYFTHIFLEENQSNILDGLLMFWKTTRVVQKRGIVAMMKCWRQLINRIIYVKIRWLSRCVVE